MATSRRRRTEGAENEGQCAGTSCWTRRLDSVVLKSLPPVGLLCFSLAAGQQQRYALVPCPYHLTMTETPTKRRIAKPIGLYIIAVFDFISVGFVPLLTVGWVARSRDV